MKKCMETGKKKRVTVLTLSYNSPDLYATIDSVLMQSYENIQLVIVDDCSEYFPEETIVRYIYENNKGNVTAKIIKNKMNCGIIRSSNIGILASDGEYIINLAGDDVFYDENVVQDIVKEFERTGAMIITGLRSVRSPDLKAEYFVSPTKAQAKKITKFKPEKLFEEMEGFNFVFGCCTARSRECIEKHGLYDEKYFYLDDYSINMRLLRNGVKFHFYERIFIKYRSNGVSSASGINQKYVKESDLLFETEIQPYSKNPWHARRKYEFWKRKTEFTKEFLARKTDCKRTIDIVWLKLWMFVLHPVIAASFVKDKFENLRGNKWKSKH